MRNTKTNASIATLPRTVSKPRKQTPRRLRRPTRTGRSFDGSGKPPAYMTPNRIGREDQPPPPPYMTPGRGGAQLPPRQPEARARAGGKEKKSPAGVGVGKLLHKKARTWEASDGDTAP